MRKLYLQFKDGNARRKTLIVEHCHQDLNAEVVYQAMKEIIALQLFERNGTQLYVEIIGAKYVEKRTEVLFDVDKQPTSSKAEAAEKSAENVTASEEWVTQYSLFVNEILNYLSLYYCIFVQYVKNLSLQYLDYYLAKNLHSFIDLQAEFNTS